MDLEQQYDYIVVGSGPGGATLAKELASQGKRVLIVEYGPRLARTGMLAMRNAYKDESGSQVVSTEGIWIGRPRVLGGASYLAMGNAVTPPTKILREWGIDLEAELASARVDLGVQPMPDRLVGPGTRRINEGARSLGWEMKPTPKCVNLDKCTGCGLCMFGCPAGAKWTAVEFVDQAVSDGADLLLNTEVQAVLQHGGSVTGVLAKHGGSQVELNAETVILCAGALSTPRILQNSGLDDAGHGLALDAFQTTYGSAEDVGMRGEPILATYLDVFIEDEELFPAPYMYVPYIVLRDVEGGAPTRLSLFGEMWRLLRSRQVDTSHMIGMMTKIRDQRTGTVHNDGTIEKGLTAHDRKKLDQAYEINRQILIAAGADPETIFRGIVEAGHPCCTAAIGEVVDEYQETKIGGLYVSDASVFPSPLGMPPILTIVALSKRLAARLLS
jgi:choline dehydrogenase-like flavoprotein